MNFPILGSTEKISIRPTRPEDLDQLVEWMNNPEIQKTFVEKPRMFSVDGQTVQIQRMEVLETPKAILYSIFLKAQLIGRLKLSKINWVKKSAHISILIAPNPDLRGKGYGTVALKLLVDLAVKLQLKKLISKVQKNNTPSIIIHENVGFKKEKQDETTIFLGYEV